MKRKATYTSSKSKLKKASSEDAEDTSPTDGADDESSSDTSDDMIEEELDEQVDRNKQIDTILRIDNKIITILTRADKVVKVKNSEETRKEYDITEKMIQDCKDKLDNRYLLENDSFNDDLSESQNAEITPSQVSQKRVQDEIDLRIDIGTLYKDEEMKLHDYQIKGVSWLLKNYMHDKNIILADDMGIGKTVQVISTINYLMKYDNIKGPFLLIVPKSILNNWVQEFERWKVQHIQVLPYYGSVERKRVLQKYEIFYDDSIRERYLLPNVVITTKDSITKQHIFENIHWKYIVIDEAHFLSNQNSKVYKKLKKLKTDSWLLLTGTPIQNNLSQFYSLLSFINQTSQFGTLKEFKNLYKTDSDDFKFKLSEIMLRRTKEQVLGHIIKPKEEYIYHLEPTPLQNYCYEHVKSLFDKENDNTLQIISDMMKISNHPFMYLLEKHDHRFIHRSHEDEQLDIALSQHACSSFLNTLSSIEQITNKIINTSSKFVILDHLLEKNFKEGNKVVIFSQYTTTLDIIEFYVKLKSYKYQRLDGSTSMDDRNDAIESFTHENSQDFIFLLSTKAGGFGLNLVSANVVIEFDMMWNPNNDNQATNRCHRLGQKKTVYVYKFVIKDSIEEKVFQYGHEKMKLANDVASATNKSENDYCSNALLMITRKQLQKMLQSKKKHYSMLFSDWEEFEYRDQFLELSFDNSFTWYQDKDVSSIIELFRKYPNTDYLLNSKQLNKLKNTYTHSFLEDMLNQLNDIVTTAQNSKKKKTPIFFGQTIENIDTFRTEKFQTFLRIYEFYTDSSFEHIIRYGCVSPKSEQFLFKLQPLYDQDELELHIERHNLNEYLTEFRKLIESAKLSDKAYLKQISTQLQALGRDIMKYFDRPYHRKQVWDHFQSVLNLPDMHDIYLRLHEKAYK